MLDKPFGKTTLMMAQEALPWIPFGWDDGGD